MLNVTVGSGWSFTPLDMHLMGACSILFWFGLLALIAAVIFKIVHTAFGLVETQAKNKERIQMCSILSKPFLNVLNDPTEKDETRRCALTCLVRVYTGSDE